MVALEPFKRGTPVLQSIGMDPGAVAASWQHSIEEFPFWLVALCGDEFSSNENGVLRLIKNWEFFFMGLFWRLKSIF